MAAGTSTLELARLFRECFRPRIRQADPAAVIADNRVVLRKTLPHKPESWPVPLHLEVRKVAQHPDQQGTCPNDRVRDPRAVRGGAKPNLGPGGAVPSVP